ncbi:MULTISPECIES: membrane protein insertase YidC [Enterococcaceae]|uniref:membrane protein insertase YidC n=1 Tax=Enterococcaceae TaxID=81852 RepID=UPI000E4D489E|nr:MULTISPECIES: membrane protein insertase YidC [Enterococcaceae]MCI0129952.1 membrane protein insertase YidC [Vagococcus sp. CY53-2]RGI30822.1 membrane protein insertase YidC [Melissococcus sp. OM08-11BH]
MKNLKRWMIGSGLFGLLIFLSGCVKTDSTGAPTGEGFVYNVLVKPMSHLITFFAENWGLGFGWSIILLTMIVRLIILPLGLSQMKKSMIQQEKMAAIKPHMDVINERMKTATSPEEKMAAQQELQQFYKDNDINIMGGIGCLPLLIQMPIFTALFFAAKVTPGISESVFFGINLGKPSLILVALAGISYFLQSYISMIGMSDEQRKQMRMMTYLSPLMIIFFSFKAPAGVTLYWVIGGIFSCIQSLITNLYHKPKVKKEIAEHFEKNPVKVVKSAVKPTPTKQNTPKNKITTNNGGRNQGKQNKK